MTNTHASDSWIWCPQPNPQARLRLFCFPHAGGSASTFYDWSNALPSAVELCLVQFPGRGNRLRESPFRQFSPVVQTLAQVLQSYINKPFVFWGHSLGAVISFEIARRLRQLSAPEPCQLFVSGSRAPHAERTEPPIHQLPTEEFLEKLRCLNGTPESILQNAELMQLMLPVLRADFAVHETYVYITDEPLNCSIVAMGGSQDEEVSHSELLAWREHTSGVFKSFMFSGGHFYLHSDRDAVLKVTSEELIQWL